MNNEQIYSILGQGLDIANKNGAYSLADSKAIADALIELGKVLGLNQDQQAPEMKPVE